LVRPDVFSVEDVARVRSRFLSLLGVGGHQDLDAAVGQRPGKAPNRLDIVPNREVHMKGVVLPQFLRKARSSCLFSQLWSRQAYAHLTEVTEGSLNHLAGERISGPRRQVLALHQERAFQANSLARRE